MLLLRWQRVVTLCYEGDVFQQHFPHIANILSCWFVWFVFLGCSRTDQGCKRAVLETRGKRSAGERFLPFSAAQHYPSSRSPQLPGDGQQATRRHRRKSHPVKVQVKAERNVP